MLALALAINTLTATWTYAGFAANPPNSPPPPPAAPVIPPEPPAPSVPPEPPPAPPSPPVAPASAVRYRMADVTGQLWEHADPAVLRAFVLERNAWLTRPTYVVRPSRFAR